VDQLYDLGTSSQGYEVRPWVNLSLQQS